MALYFLNVSKRAVVVHFLLILDWILVIFGRWSDRMRFEDFFSPATCIKDRNRCLLLKGASINRIAMAFPSNMLTCTW